MKVPKQGVKEAENAPNAGHPTIQPITHVDKPGEPTELVTLVPAGLNEPTEDPLATQLGKLIDFLENCDRVRRPIRGNFQPNLARIVPELEMQDLLRQIRALL